MCNLTEQMYGLSRRARVQQQQQQQPGIVHSSGAPASSGGKKDWKKNSWSWWVFHFEECRDIYRKRTFSACEWSSSNSFMDVGCNTLVYIYISKEILPDIYGMFAWSVGCRYRFTEDLSDCEGGPPFVCLGSNSDVQVIVGELQMVPMSSRRLGAFLLCLLLPILHCTFNLLGKRN